VGAGVGRDLEEKGIRETQSASDVRKGRVRDE
jgi:hypothetical protein